MSHIKINEAKCKSCYLCIDACPKKLIQKSNNIGPMAQYTVEFNDTNNQCIGCAICAMVCPDMAIEEVVNDK